MGIGEVPQVQRIVPQVVPQVTPYVQPIRSRHTIDQNHLGIGLAPGSFNILGGSPYGRISQIAAATPGVAGTTPLSSSVGGLNPASNLQHVEILRSGNQRLPLNRRLRVLKHHRRNFFPG